MVAKRIAVLGAGQIGRIIARMLREGGHEVVLADASAATLASAGAAVATQVVDVADQAALKALLADRDIVVSACPYFLNKGIAEAAAATGTHYFDLTEDVETTRFIRDLAARSSSAFAPQCGLAPGFICILGADMMRRFDTVRSVKMRVGALPLYPTNALGYNVTWSVDGLINEYCNPCETVVGGRKIHVAPLEGLEHVMIDGVAYEAFNTSGGLGTLTETFDGAVQEMSYKTLRYPGHAAIMKLLLEDLGLGTDRDTMRAIMGRAAPFTRKDIVIVFVTGIGEREGRLEEVSHVLRYLGTPDMSAIQLTTAAGCVAMVELFLAGKLPQKGFVRQEDADLAAFLATRAGRLLVDAADRGTADLVSHEAPRRAA
ncbi:saccharopine dehydrogenase family protein [Rhizobiales bacterium Sp-1]|uniref:Saccharopine dehydrogenase family protein n=2 Tax=Segnochrobactrum spirostomi TaxID=2608987 RepID=A0A6A7Y9L7_9HYPH|nr:saccharopine dehydrogenase family protein [Segnochrobactrum spirostomi]